MEHNQEALLRCASDRALAQVAQRGSGISLEISKSHLDMALGALLWVPCLYRGWARGTQKSLTISVMLGFCKEEFK